MICPTCTEGRSWICGQCHQCALCCDCGTLAIDFRRIFGPFWTGLLTNFAGLDVVEDKNIAKAWQWDLTTKKPRTRVLVKDMVQFKDVLKEAGVEIR